MRPAHPARVVVVLLAALAVSLVPAHPPAGLAEPDATPTRIAGVDRVDTAARVATSTFEPRPETATALVARADDFPDALSAAALAGAVDGPVLLTHRDALPAATTHALEALEIDEVLVLGGPAAVSADVEAELARVFAVDRVHGRDRYATAAAVARRAAEQAGVATIDGRTTVLIAAGGVFADAVAGGAAAAAGPHPLLLTEHDRLPAATAEALDELAPDHAIVLGGPAAVADTVLDAIAARGPTVERVAGAERTATAARLADVLVDRLGFDPQTVLLARGDAFPDALAAGPRAGRLGAPILLSQSPGRLGAATQGWLGNRCGAVSTLQALGGSAAVGHDIFDEALRAVRICRDGVTRFGVATAVHPDTGADPHAFAEVVQAVLADPEGWASPGGLELPVVGGDEADLVVVLAPPEHIVEASGACRPDRSCRVGDTLYVHAGQWGSPPPPWQDDPAGYRRYVVNHLVGHWLGQGHASCPGAGQAAPVMQPQTDDLDGCAPSSRPAAWERGAVHRRYVRTVEVSLAGDVHGEGVVRQELLAGRNPLAPIAPVLSAADVTVVNLETAVGTTGRPANKTFTFQAPPQLVQALRAAGVDVVTLANNHALDYGVEAMFETIDHARRAGLQVVGAGRNSDEAYAPAVVDVRGRRLAVVGLSRVLSPGWAAGPGRPGLASAYDEHAAAAAVRRAADIADHVVVAIHWGVELAECPASHQLRLSRLLVDAGADVIAGHHPHILQGIQSQGDAIVAYSLGNFVWYHRREPSRYTGVVTATLPRAAADWTFTPAEIDGRGRPIPVDGAVAQRIRSDVGGRSPGGGRCSFS